MFSEFIIKLHRGLRFGGGDADICLGMMGRLRIELEMTMKGGGLLKLAPAFEITGGRLL